MLDFKSLLLNAGLVTQTEVDKATAQKNRKPAIKKPVATSAKAPVVRPPQPSIHQEKLKKLPKTDQYALIRKWVSLNRLDKARILDESCEKFYFQKEDQSITWLSLEKEVIEQVNNGTAAIMTYMSNSGPSNCVIPREIAEDVREVFPVWIRVLK